MKHHTVCVMEHHTVYHEASHSMMS